MRIALPSLLICLILSRACASAGSGRGLWLLPRKDCGNTARCDVPGKMRTAPVELWSYGSAPDVYSSLRPVSVGGQRAFLAHVRTGVRLIRPDGGIIWNRPAVGVSAVMDVVEQGALVMLGAKGFALLNLATGKTLWTWYVSPDAYLGGCRVIREGSSTRLVVFPQNSMQGCCFEFQPDAKPPKLLWRQDYTGHYWQNFGPFFVFADMDNDGTREIVLIGKPGYAGVIDLDTGAVKMEARYDVTGGDHIGRPYGLIVAEDVDGDGWRDIVVVSCQVEEYVSVIRNNRGKSLSPVWSRFVGLDFPTEAVALRPSVTSLADVNGDGVKELVVGLFNEHGDGRWHTIIFDTMKGYDARIADLPDRYPWGCYDLNGDRRPEIITSIEKDKSAPNPTGLQAVDGKTLKDIAALDGAAPVFLSTHLPDGTDFRAVRRTPVYVTLPGTARGLLVAKDGQESVWRVREGEAVVQPFRMSPHSRMVFNSEGTGIVRQTDLKIGGGKAAGIAASGPLVAEAGGRRELILSQSDGTIIGGAPDFSKPGAFSSSWQVKGATPSVWIGPDGRRVVCAMDPSDEAVVLYDPSAGHPEPYRRIETPLPITRGYNTRSAAELMPFGERELRVYVGLHSGVHAMAGALYDESGARVWMDNENGPYPRIPAAGDLKGDGACEVVVDNHGKHLIYDAKGVGKLIAQGWGDGVPGRSDGAKYAVPIIGPFGPGGATRTVMSGGLDALETLDPLGARLAKGDFESTYVFQWCGPAVARMRGGEEWDIGMVNGEGVFYCYDVNTCRVRWTLDLGVKATSPINVCGGDVDGDGKDNFIVSLPDGRLLALDEKDGKGRVLWKTEFDAAVSDAIMADVDGDGAAEIIVELNDGRVKIMGSRRGKGQGE